MKNKKAVIPLLYSFLELNEKGLNIGLTDYQLFLQALKAGYGNQSRRDLVFTCQTLWGKTIEEQNLIKETIERGLPAKVNAMSVTSVIQKIIQKIRFDSAQAGPKLHLGEKEKQGKLGHEHDASPQKGPVKERADRKDSNRLHNNFDHFGKIGQCKIYHRIPALNEVGNLDNLKIFDFRPSLPFSPRQMAQGWRLFRRLQPGSPTNEIDALATLSHWHDFGVFSAPVFIFEPINRAKLFVFIDRGTQMLPFRRVVTPFLKSISESGLECAKFFFLGDHPTKNFFTDWHLTRVYPFRAIKPKLRKSGILIFSGAGAGAINSDPFHHEQLILFAQKIQQFTRDIAWLNPFPVQRWHNSMTRSLQTRTGIPMFPFDKTGHCRSVKIICGRKK